MSAASAFEAARAAGISFRIDGDDLLLEAAAPPLPAVLDLLTRNKAGVLALLRNSNDWFGATSPLETVALFRAGRDDAIAERAAIMEFDGGLPRDWAEALAAICAGPRPQACSKTDWPVLCDAVLRFADRFGAMLAGLGWSFNDVFGLRAFWLRLDQRGVAWFVRGGHVVEADADMIIFERDGARYTHSRA